MLYRKVAREQPTRSAAQHRLRFLGSALVALLQLASAGEANPIRFTHLDQTHGLSQNTVLSAFQDSEGFLWFGTEDGLNRFDGYSVKVYKNDPSNPNSLPDDLVWAIAETSTGDLWIGTAGAGLVKWRRDSDRFERQQVAEDVGYVRTLLVDRTDRIWIGTRNAGLHRLEPSSGAVREYRHRPSDPDSLNHDDVFDIYEDSRGSIWVATDAGIAVVDPVTEQLRRIETGALKDGRVRALVEDASGGLWVGTNNGALSRLNVTTGRFERVLESSNGNERDSTPVHALLRDDADRLWVGTKSGLRLLDPATGELESYAHDASAPDSLADDLVMSLLQDRGGVIWVGTRSGGVSRFSPASWSFGRYASSGNAASLGSENVTSFAEAADGRLWVGSFGGGLDLLDRQENTVRHHRHESRDPGSLSSDRVMALVAGRDGTLWIGTLDGGLNRLAPGRRRFESFLHEASQSDSLGSNGVMSLLEDSAERLWVGTFRGGLNRFVPATRSFVQYRHDPADPTSLSSDIVTALAEAPDGKLWVASEAGGLNRLDPETGRFDHIRHDPDDPLSLPSDTVFALHVAADGVLWVGTRGGGLGRLDTLSPEGVARFTHVSERDGLPNDVIYGIEPDTEGRLWLSTNAGLASFDPGSGEVKRYGRSHGLQAAEFNFGAHYRSAQGELFFGGPGGFNAFRPAELEPGSTGPRVAMTGFLKFGEAMPSQETALARTGVHLAYDDDVVSFEFAALDYVEPAHNRYAYRLEGFNDSWIQLGETRRVTFTDLDAGEYQLSVRAANSDGVWNDAGLSIPILVAPPPWRTGWAYVLYATLLLAAAGSVAQALRKRVAARIAYQRRLEEEVQLRTRELAERKHELEDANTKLHEASLTDALTGMRNRRFLFEEITKDLVFFQHNRHDGNAGPGQPMHLMLMMVDLDHFKPINDSCGHVAGDRVLVQVRGVLEKACRRSDILVRWGGDEFLVVGPNHDVADMERVAERVRSAIERTPFDIGEGRVARLTCSIGFTRYPFVSAEPHSLSLEQVIALADNALYAAKGQGRNAWVGVTGSSLTTVNDLVRSLGEDPGHLLESQVLGVRSSLASASTQQATS